MVAEEPLPPRCWPSWSVRRSTRLRRSARTWRPSTRRRTRIHPGPRCGGLSLPDRHRAGALRRTFRSRWPVGSAVGGGARDACRDRLQAAGESESDRLDPWRQRRCRDAHPAAAGYVDEVARDPGPGQAVLYGTTPTFLERLGIDSVEDLPPLGEFFPEADVVEALERGLRVGSDDDDSMAPTPSRPTLITVARTSEPPRAAPGGSGCRRSWPESGSAAGGSVRRSSLRAG